jgi:hypothetical protein
MPSSANTRSSSLNYADTPPSSPVFKRATPVPGRPGIVELNRLTSLFEDILLNIKTRQEVNPLSNTVSPLASTGPPNPKHSKALNSSATPIFKEVNEVYVSPL